METGKNPTEAELEATLGQDPIFKAAREKAEAIMEAARVATDELIEEFSSEDHEQNKKLSAALVWISGALAESAAKQYFAYASGTLQDPGVRGCAEKFKQMIERGIAAGIAHGRQAYAETMAELDEEDGA